MSTHSSTRHDRTSIGKRWRWAARVRHVIGFLARTTPALTRELPPVEVAKALDLSKADIFEQASELGRGIDAEPERRCGAVRRPGPVCARFHPRRPGGVRVGLNYPRHLVSGSSSAIIDDHRR